MNYSKKNTNKGFGAQAQEALKRQNTELHQLHILVNIGIAQVFNEEMQMVEPDCLQFVQNANKRDFDGNCRFFDMLCQGEALEANMYAGENYSTDELHFLYEELESYLMTIAEVSGFDFDTPAEMWSARTGRTYENPRGGIMSAHNAGLEAMNADLRRKNNDLFDAEEALSQAIEKQTPWQLVDCGMMLSPDSGFVAVGGFRDAVFALNDDVPEVALRVYSNPRRVESDDIIPPSIASVISEWEAVA